MRSIGHAIMRAHDYIHDDLGVGDSMYYIAGFFVIVGIVAQWRLYEKAHQPGWTCLVPILNMVVFLRIVGRPASHLFLLFIPIVGQFYFLPKMWIETAESFGRNRIALVGEAAHVIPPIGAQGLNLGLRDAATIAELVVESAQAGHDIGSPDLLAQYHRMRRTDVSSRTVAVDVLNRSLLSDFLPVQGARGFGLYLLDRIGPLRRAVMREGVEPAAQPRLMRGEAL